MLQRAGARGGSGGAGADPYGIRSERGDVSLGVSVSSMGERVSVLPTPTTNGLSLATFLT